MKAVLRQMEFENCSRGIAVRHPKMCHPVERGTSYKHLRHLPLKLTRTHSRPEYRLDPKHLRLGQTPAVIATFFLPLFAPDSTDSPQVLISDKPLAFAVAVLPNLGVAPRWDGCTRSSFSYRLITVAPVIRAIAAHLPNLLRDLPEQVIDNLAVGQVVGCNNSSRDFTGGFIGADVQLAPGPAFGVAVLTNFPFALAEYLYAGRIYDQMQGLILFTTRQDYLKALAAAAQACIVRHAQIQVEQLHNRDHQPLSRAQRQVIDLLQSGHAKNGGIRVVARFPSPAAFLVVAPQSKDVITNPESKTSALNKSVVILFPIAEAVSALGFLFLHKLRIPALPPSCLCNKAMLICNSQKPHILSRYHLQPDPLRILAL